ncbi:MAG: ferredoxin [Clostridiales bacterium 43-6]|nr:MAG: ferredoxin [Clostridiales bacterium 43-6]
MYEGTEKEIRIVVGMATCGIAAGARPVLNALVDEVTRRKLNNVVVTQTGCIGICQFEPVIEITTPELGKVTYVKVTAEKIPQIITEHVVNGKPVEQYTIGAYKK